MMDDAQRTPAELAYREWLRVTREGTLEELGLKTERQRQNIRAVTIDQPISSWVLFEAGWNAAQARPAVEIAEQPDFSGRHCVVCGKELVRLVGRTKHSEEPIPDEHISNYQKRKTCLGECHSILLSRSHRRVSDQEILDAYAAEGSVMSRAARKLGVSAETIKNRLDSIQRRGGPRP